MILWATFGEQWALNQKVDFNPIDKVITTSPYVTLLDIATDVYAAWLQWRTLYDYGTYPAALSGIGGYFYLLDNWQFNVDRHITDVTGYLNPIDMVNVAIDNSYMVQLLMEIHAIMGLTQGTPLRVTGATRTAGTLTQSISETRSGVTVTRTSPMPEGQPSMDTATQIALLTEMHRMMGLDIANPLIATNTTKQAGTIVQQISEDGADVTITRVS